MLLVRTCPVCGRPGSVCPACLAELVPAPVLPPPPGVDACRALLAYEGTGSTLVARLKYRNHRGALPGLAAAVATLVEADEVDVVTWAPTTARRRRSRGYDQSELLARAVAGRLRRPCRSVLRRVPGPAQTSRPAAERWQGPIFEVRRRLAGHRILVVDDVVTTGATAAAAARSLRAGGAATVVVLALARTPLKATTESDEE